MIVFSVFSLKDAAQSELSFFGRESRRVHRLESARVTDDAWRVVKLVGDVLRRADAHTDELSKVSHMCVYRKRIPDLTQIKSSVVHLPCSLTEREDSTRHANVIVFYTLL